MNAQIIKTPSHWLATELAERQLRNPRFSLRTLSAKIGISPGRLSEFISGKREVTMGQAERIADRLNYSPSTKSEFFDVVKLNRPKSRAVPETPRYSQISADKFQIIADWQHIAILSLMDTKGFKFDAEWISLRIGIPKSRVESALERLLRSELVKKSGHRYVKTNKNFETTHDISSPALRLSHRQSIQQAADALDNVPLASRDITSITMAIDPTKLPKAKKLIQDFRHRLSKILESGPQSEVFNLNIQLVPVTLLNATKGK